jgi:hypothetical protein
MRLQQRKRKFLEMAAKHPLRSHCPNSLLPRPSPRRSFSRVSRSLLLCLTSYWTCKLPDIHYPISHFTSRLAPNTMQILHATSSQLPLSPRQDHCRQRLCLPAPFVLGLGGCRLQGVQKPRALVTSTIRSYQTPSHADRLRRVKSPSRHTGVDGIVHLAAPIWSHR